MPVVTATQPTIDFKIDIELKGMCRAIAENGIIRLRMGAAEIDIAIAITLPVVHGLIGRIIDRPAVDVKIISHIPTLIVIASRSIGVVVGVEITFAYQVSMACAIGDFHGLDDVMDAENAGGRIISSPLSGAPGIAIGIRTWAKWRKQEYIASIARVIGAADAIGAIDIYERSLMNIRVGNGGPARRAVINSNRR